MNRLLTILFLTSFLSSCNESKELFDNFKLIKGSELYGEGKYEEAKRIYLNVINSNAKIDSTTLSNIYTLIGNVYEKQDSLKMAEKYYLKSKKMDDTYWEIWFHLAVYYDKTNDLERAKTNYNQAVKLNPKNNSLLNNSALFYFERGNNSQALDLINQSFEIDSLNETSIWLKSKILNKIKTETKN
ncbi:Photosystem I assembly protein Ycf3 [Kordia antarctica]|uniref:Photosystem I assembly protein Ycf3 n=1 Tax=Kordia antarctica TaxID=1218801 RepID=A0A7L4ZGY7_9FLAO|nr:tetratricopeptide repeat protein [Kordia antarctica]QHI35516.1 Photosystem I assembly protein Ycf3 [Kordia antarctica]QHI36053.1 Photosystem I assembly protein Ycf3 [Kordia antarctica]